MKVKFTPYLLLSVIICILSCSKEKSFEPGNEPPKSNPAESGLLTGWRQGITTDDTLFSIAYDEKKRIKSVNNTSWHDEFIATYDDADNLISITENYPGHSLLFAEFKYNANHQLTEVNHRLWGGPSRFIYEYTSGVLSKKSYYSADSNDPTTFKLRRYFIYEVTDGNITSSKEYDNAGRFNGETTYTYTSETNVFKSLALLNYVNNLGLYDMATDQSFVNKNMLAGSSRNGQKTAYTYTYNSNKQLTGFIANTWFGVFTWTLSY